MSTTADARGNLHQTAGPGGGQFARKTNSAPTGMLSPVGEEPFAIPESFYTVWDGPDTCAQEATRAA